MNLEHATVFVIDDEPANVVLVNRTLAKVGYERIIGITDPRSAWAAIVEASPDLVLLDLNMPHVDGYEILAQLQDLPAKERPAVLVLTADASDSSRQRALALGAKDFITKPFRMVELVLRVRNQLETVMMARQLAVRTRRLEHDIAAARGETEEVRELRRRASLIIDEVIDTTRFSLDLEPVVDLRGGEQVGVGVRASIVDELPIPGADWFSVARALGFGNRLELAALRHCLSVARMLPGNQFASVRVSPALSTDAILRGVLAEHDVSRVVLEVAPADPAEAAQIDELAFGALRTTSGLRISLQLHELALAIEPLLTWRPDVVVLPQALCDGIYDDELRRALIRALTTFASDTGTTLHAAGVNDRNEADLLWALGVTWASGPLFSDRPPNHAVGPEAATDLGSILSAVP